MKSANEASIRARLKNIADKEQKPFDFILLLYFNERLLYRLSISKYSKHFVLKGGLLLYSLTDEQARPTKDIDFLGREIINDIDKIREIFIEICDIPVNDAVVYDSSDMTCESIKEDADYEGIRIKLIAYLGNARKVLQIDIGFGDIIIPKPHIIEYPTLLDMENPVILAYSKESVISEKFEAMLYLADVNSRMKDFYDVYNLCVNFDFNGEILYKAIRETLTQRATPISNDPVVFTETFKNDKNKQTQWNAFRRRANVAIGLEFFDIMSVLCIFLMPMFEALIMEREFSKQWCFTKLKWV